MLVAWQKHSISFSSLFFRTWYEIVPTLIYLCIVKDLLSSRKRQNFLLSIKELDCYTCIFYFQKRSPSPPPVRSKSTPKPKPTPVRSPTVTSTPRNDTKTKSTPKPTSPQVSTTKPSPVKTSRSSRVSKSLLQSLVPLKLY